MHFSFLSSTKYAIIVTVLCLCGQSYPTIAIGIEETRQHSDVSKTSNMSSTAIPSSRDSTFLAVSSTTQSEDTSNPPLIEGVKFDPSSPATGDHLKAIVAAKGLERSKSKIFYRWKVNGSLVQDTESDLLHHPLWRGDFVEVEVGAGENAPENRLSHCVSVDNAPPRINLVSQTTDPNGFYRASVEMSDPEDDPITVSLKEAPSGMTFNEAERLITWSIPPELEGIFRVSVSARDSFGAETLLNYSITVNWEQPQTEKAQDASEHSPQ